MCCSEYIIDLMGAPGTLIPAEVPSSLLLDTALEARGFSNSTAAVNNLSLVFDKVVGLTGAITDLVKTPESCGSNLNDGASLSTQATQENPVCVKSDVTEKSEEELEKSFRSEISLCDGLQSPVEKASLAQEKKVKDVSKYVISAAKDPEFAQKLHAVLLESGAAPPADLFLNINPYILGEKKFLEQVQLSGREFLQSGASYSAQDYRSNNEMLLLCSSGAQPLNLCDDKGESSMGCFPGQQLLPAAKVPCSSLGLEPEGRNGDLVAVEASRLITTGATNIDSSPSIPSKMDEGASFEGILLIHVLVNLQVCWLATRSLFSRILKGKSRTK